VTRQSYWNGSKRLPRYPRLESNCKVDVAIVGGGITGITAAYLLKKAGRTVALIERDRFAKADTGHTTAHHIYVTDIRLPRLTKDFGRDHAQGAWDAGRAAINQIADLVETVAIDCDFRWVPGFLHAPVDSDDDEKQKKDLEPDAKLAAELGFPCKLIDAAPLVYKPAVRFANQAKFHPIKYLAALMETIPGKGSHLFENSEATEFKDELLSIGVNDHTVKCDYIILATHVPLMGETGLLSASLFQTKLFLYSSYAVGARLKKGAAQEASYWDTADPYNYLRIDRHARNDYAILGGEDHKTGQESDTDACYARLEERLKKLLPGAEIDYRWTGQVVETNDGLPFIGETAERQFVATGFAGNGMTFGTLGAMMAVDRVLGRKNPWEDLFDVGRKKIKGGTWDYLKENIDYPYYYLRDRLAGAEAESVDSLRPGEGKILKVDGQRVAAFRNPNGSVTQLSPVCTHMGCLVRWNQADSTWDCPCHGSRFKPTGAVVGGPAEAPLEKIQK
jgi:glycine/D-amino acid oxidase-like deaminating enzyme/nitrite reductase/ring-hydroxylating ferredoxin subunit